MARMFNEITSPIFEARFQEFRDLEWEAIKGKKGDGGSWKAFSLLRDMEMCYATKAYFACLVVACTAIEASLNEALDNDDSLFKNLKRSGYAEEADWLRLIRNEIVHKVNTGFVDYSISTERETELDELCKKAFFLVHTIHFNPIKTSETA